MVFHLLPAIEFLLYAALTAFMLHATWLTWPDAFIDFSRELYLPWRVSCGDVLYRDLAYYFGPVSVYTNAALFALLGHPSIHALFALNFVFWIATLLALRAILRRIASPLASTIAVSSFILLFSFSRYLLVGNYNFLAPYSHEITRGFLFALLSILSFDSAFRRFPATPPFPGFPARFLLPGLLYALVLFAKPELALASTVSLALLFVLHSREHGILSLRPLLAFSLAASVSIALVATPFAVAFRSMPRALHDTLLKLYLDCLNPDLTAIPFFRNVLGTDRLLPNISQIFLGLLFVLLPFIGTRFAFSRLTARSLRISATFLFSALAAVIGWAAWACLNSVLPVAPLGFLFLLLWKREHSSDTKTPNPDASSPLAATFALFAFLLISKMFLNASVTFYGFVLAVPAFCCALLLAFRQPCALWRAAIAVSFLLAFLVGGLYRNAVTLRHWDIRHPVHDKAFLSDPVNAQAFNTALDWIRNNTPSSSTLAILPEGGILNVLADRPNPTPYTSLPVTDIPRYDSGELLAAYSNNPPDILVLVAKLGGPQFGVDYAQDLMSLLSPLYSPVFTIPLATPSGPIPYLLIAQKE